VPDKKIVCRDCKSLFVFDEGEQEFFKERNYSDPKRCPGCRKNHRDTKKARNEGGS